MELALKNGFVELSDMEMYISDGEGVPEAAALGILSIGAGIAVCALTPCKKTGVKIIVEGAIAAQGLYYV